MKNVGYLDSKLLELKLKSASNNLSPIMTPKIANTCHHTMYTFEKLSITRAEVILAVIILTECHVITMLLSQNVRKKNLLRVKLKCFCS